MFTRSRQSQGNFPNAGPPQRQGGPHQFKQQNYPQQNYGNFHSNLNRQGFKMQNPTQFVRAQHQEQQMPQHQMVPPPQQQQQVQAPQVGASSPQMVKAVPKPILKNSTPAGTTPVAPQTPVAAAAASSPAIANQQQQPTMVPPPTTPAAVEPNNDQNNSEMEVDADGQQIRRWKRKAPGLMKTNRKLKRMRLNQKLRKTLQPKNAIMVLNEMKTGVQFTFPETQNAMSSSLFLVHAEIDGKIYVGQGLSKPLARQNAAENALKSLLQEKMAASAKVKYEGENESQPMEIKEGQDGGNQTDGSCEIEMNMEEGDEIPWSSLASFALYKLFLEWQNQGTIVPVPRPVVTPNKVRKEVKPHVQKELPPNALNIHPVMLLNQMRPGLIYVEAKRVGNPPNTVFTLCVEIDGTQYQGTAKNKRDAKKAAAKVALQALYNLTYPEEAQLEHGENAAMV